MVIITAMQDTADGAPGGEDGDLDRMAQMWGAGASVETSRRRPKAEHTRTLAHERKREIGPPPDAAPPPIVLSPVSDGYMEGICGTSAARDGVEANGDVHQIL
jgi:hypothetical protein